MPRPRGAGGGSSPSGTGGRELFSTPAAMYTSPSPALMAWAAERIDCRLDEQKRLRVRPGTLWGKPARRPAVRAMLNPVSPVWATLPQMMSKMSARSTSGTLSMSAFRIVAMSSSAR